MKYIPGFKIHKIGLAAFLFLFTSMQAEENRLEIGILKLDGPPVHRTLSIDELGNYYLDQEPKTVDELSKLYGKPNEFWAIEEADNLSNVVRSNYLCDLQSFSVSGFSEKRKENCQKKIFELLEDISSKMSPEELEELQQKRVKMLREKLDRR